jgi:tetratricopeptide (TPR) repeat protein
MRYALALGISLLAGCATAPVGPPPAELFHDARFAPPTERIDAADVFALNDEMRRYVREQLDVRRAVRGTRQALLDALLYGDLRLEYDSAHTRTAAEAFQARSGNCLSLVILTGALAKELGMSVQYNHAFIPDLWSRTGNVYFLNGHVNVTLGRRSFESRFGFDSAALMTIDFLPPLELQGLRVEPLEEATIIAMFMNNRAAEALVRGRLDDAYWWARAAMNQAPAFMAAFNTLGVIYMRSGEPADAERVFRHVLAADPRNTRAWANLALALARQGHDAEARSAEGQLARLEGEAPFYFFHKGLAAMEAGDFRAAKSFFTRELDRDPDYHEFHFWLALAELRLGNIERARAELALAQQNSTTRLDHDLYGAKLRRLSLLQR